MLQDGKTLPRNAQWASVTLTTNSLPGEVVAVSASYDQTLKFGAQTPFSDAAAGADVGRVRHASVLTVQFLTFFRFSAPPFDPS